MVARNKAETHYKSFIHFLKGSALRNCRTMPRLTWYSVTLTQRQRRRAWEDQAVIGVMLPEAKEDCGHGSCKRQGLSLRPSGRSMALPPWCESILALKVEAVQGIQVSLEWTYHQYWGHHNLNSLLQEFSALPAGGLKAIYSLPSCHLNTLCKPSPVVGNLSPAKILILLRKPMKKCTEEAVSGQVATSGKLATAHISYCCGADCRLSVSSA